MLILPRDPIQSVREEGVMMAPGKPHPPDVLVLATGYDFVVGSLLFIAIRGRDNLSPAEKMGHGHPRILPAILVVPQASEPT